MNPYQLPDHFLESLLQEDSPCGDATTFALGIGQQPGHLVFRARQEMVLCGSEEARRMGELRGLLAVGPLRESGSRLKAGEEILRLNGNAASLHLVWKTAQTLMEYLSGIASSVAEISAAAQRGNPETSVVCTRKNFPGTKAAAIKAVLCGGASPHRLSLSETLLIFPSTVLFLRTRPPPAPWNACANAGRSVPSSLKWIAQTKRGAGSMLRSTSCNWKNFQWSRWPRLPLTPQQVASPPKSPLPVASMRVTPKPMPVPAPGFSSPAPLISPSRVMLQSPWQPVSTLIEQSP